MAHNTDIIGCGRIADHEWLSDLDAANVEHADLAQHVADCVACQSAVTNWKLLEDGLRSLSPRDTAVKHVFVQSVIAAGNATPTPTRQNSARWQWTGALTTAAAVVVLLFALNRPPVPVANNSGHGIPLGVSAISMVLDETATPLHIVPHNVTHVRDDATPQLAPQAAPIYIAHGRTVQ